METDSGKQTFWEHLDSLRSDLVRIAVVTITLGLAVFFLKEELFSVILAPKSDDFIIYRLFDYLSEWLSMPGIASNAFSVKLINTGLAEQFIIHMKMAISSAFILVLPYVIYLLFCFVSPALYANERKYAVRVVGSGYVMFMLGVALNYFLIFPLIFRFLGTYQVSGEVDNLISLQSYIETLMILSAVMGIVFEIPILCWLFAKIGFLTSTFMRNYRRHSIVIILTLAAIITPTSDIFTLSLVASPMYLLYELSILIVNKTQQRTVDINNT